MKERYTSYNDRKKTLNGISFLSKILHHLAITKLSNVGPHAGIAMK
jgi:hypothetical protein